MSLSYDEFKELVLRYNAGEATSDELMDHIASKTWWVPILDGLAQANYTAEQVGYILCYSAREMDSDYGYDEWEEWTVERILQEVRNDPEYGLVFDYGYPSAVHLKPENTFALGDGLERILQRSW